MEPVDSPKQSGDAPRTVFRCARCGVESAEPACFVIPGLDDSPRYIRCVTCEERRLVPSAAYTLLVILGSIIWPLIYLVAFQKGLHEVGLPVVGFACLLYPTAIIAHELGHAVTAYLVGLEVGPIGLGSGHVVRRFELFGLPIRLHMWPISGRVYLGASSLGWLRTRLWVTTLMGPMTHVLLIAATVIWRPPLESVFGATAVSLWLYVNWILLIVNLMPRHAVKLNRPRMSDGYQLLAIPTKTREQLNIYRISALLTRALFYFEEDNFSRASGLVTQALRRDPDNLSLRLMQVSCYLSEGEYGAALDIVTPIADRAAAEPPLARAAVYNCAAFGLAMSNIGAAADNPRLLEADRLSATAFDMFPCTLDFRLTRALILVATERPLQALQLLDYPLFDTARPRTQAQRAAVQAFAHRRLGGVTEAEDAAALALQLDTKISTILSSLGVTPSPTARARSPAKPTKPAYVPQTLEHEAVSGVRLVLARLAGAVLLLVGIALVALLVLALVRDFSSLGADPGSVLTVPIVFALVGLFCFTVGYRLTFNRPSSNGSILSRNAWVVLAIVFAGVGLFVGRSAIIGKSSAGSAIVAAASSFAFAAICWKARTMRRS